MPTLPPIMMTIIKNLKLKERKLIAWSNQLQRSLQLVHRDTTVVSSDIDLECNFVIVEDSNEQFTGSTGKDLESISISSII